MNGYSYSVNQYWKKRNNCSQSEFYSEKYKSFRDKVYKFYDKF